MAATASRSANPFRRLAERALTGNRRPSRAECRKGFTLREALFGGPADPTLRLALWLCAPRIAPGLPFRKAGTQAPSRGPGPVTLRYTPPWVT